MKTIAIALAAAMLAGTALAAPPPAAIAPKVISGWGWNVMALEAQKAWYADKLGMKQVGVYSREGKVFEYIMAFGERGSGPILALLASPERKPGPSTAGRLILIVPDSKALSEHLVKEGVPTRLVAPGAYFFADPEGNPIEIYTPPAPAKS
ncbi:VOC family protein [uncultured Phenylobacterium sp.]|uniref:VOC family protein n=1 Tax=uncultured Phenylobacterium sp. TaxID=349273 RepID=UPI0025D80EA5|nr:VOC family protein [uncultured Phenylobacterium sp.]